MVEGLDVARLLKRAADEIEYLHSSIMESAGLSSDGKSNSVAVELREALAALSATEVPSPLLVAWWDKNEPSGFRWKEGVVRGDVPDGTPVYAGYLSTNEVK